MKHITFIVLLLLAANKLQGQIKSVAVSGIVKDANDKKAITYANVTLISMPDSTFTTGTITDLEGRFLLNHVEPKNYLIAISYLGYSTKYTPLYVGNLSDFLDVKELFIQSESQSLQEVTVTTKQDEVNSKLDKKSYNLDANISQSGGSILQAMSTLPGISTQDGKIFLRGNDKVTILIDGKQSALTGFGAQSGLDNLSASSVEKIEIINNPNAKQDANGNAGIINIVFKKNNNEGFNGKVSLSTGLGALWVRKENLPTIRPQYQQSPKINPAININYRKNKFNVFVQADYLFTKTLNKNEFVTRTYADQSIIEQQSKRNRNTAFTNLKSGMDWYIDAANSITISGLYGSEKIIDRGDEPIFSGDLKKRLRLWQFLEDELKTTWAATGAFQHKFKQAGHLLNIAYNYTFHREDEKYFFDDTQPSYVSKDAFKLLSDEKVSDVNVDYTKPLKFGRIETGLKLRYRNIPTNMQFFPGINSPLDTNAGGWATYREVIPAVYSNFVFENQNYEAEIGLRIEYVNLDYKVNPQHNTYKSDGYTYTQPFPSVRLAYKINQSNKITLFYNRRVDRPNEVDIRIFPKYDDVEIIKVGNPALKPMFTNQIEIGYKSTGTKGYLYTAVYFKSMANTITRIGITVPDSRIIYNVFQNAGLNNNSGIETIINYVFSKKYNTTFSLIGYYNHIYGFSVLNKYPIASTFSAPAQSIYSGNIKWNHNLNLAHKLSMQLVAIYLAPDIIPQGKIRARYTMDLGLKKSIQNGKGEFFINATDIFNTLIVKREINGNGFSYLSADYYETQTIRIGYGYKF